MKRHWVNFTVTLFGSILVEGDESPAKASEYVKRHLDCSASAEGVDAEINEQQIIIDEAYADSSLKSNGGEK